VSTTVPSQGRFEVERDTLLIHSFGIQYVIQSQVVK